MSDRETGQVGQETMDSMGSFFGDGSPTSVFSAPEQVGETLIITAAAWERAGGFGFGSGTGTDAETGEEGGGSGGGGGGSSQVRPVAVITIGPRGVDVRPVIDFTKIGVTVLLAVIATWRALRR